MSVTGSFTEHTELVGSLFIASVSEPQDSFLINSSFISIKYPQVCLILAIVRSINFPLGYLESFFDLHLLESEVCLKVCCISYKYL